jgi:hypothetical protein
MMSSRHGPYELGYTRATDGYYSGLPICEIAPILKGILNSDRSLQLESVKPESLVIAD